MDEITLKNNFYLLLNQVQKMMILNYLKMKVMRK